MNTAGMRAAIVGAGGIARVHARLIRELGGNLVGVCGRTLASARAFDAEPYDNLQQLLREQKPEVVHVCSPNHLHAEHSMMAFAAGAHVVCEKPMATDADACRRMIEAAGRAQRLGAIAYTYRGYPLIEVLRRQVAEGRFGALRRIGGCYLSQDVWAPDKIRLAVHARHDRRLLRADGSRRALAEPRGVRHRHAHPGAVGAVLDPPEAAGVARRGGQGPRPPGVAVADGAVAVETALEDQADLLLRFDNGAAGSLTVSGVSPGHPNYHPAVRRRRRARFRLEPARAERLDRARRGRVTRCTSATPRTCRWRLAWMSMLPPGHAEGYVDAFRNIVCQAWSAMRGEDLAFPGFADGLRGVSLVEAAIRSAAERRAVLVPAQSS